MNCAHPAAAADSLNAAFANKGEGNAAFREYVSDLERHAIRDVHI